MPAPTLVGTATTDVAAAGGWAPAHPAGIASGDILLWLGESVGGQSFTAPGAPWAPLDTISPVVQSTNTQLTVFWRRYDGTGSAPSLTGPADHGVAAMIAVRGCPASGNPWNNLSPGTEATSDVSATFPGCTTSVVDCLVLEILATSGDSAAAQATTLTNGAYTSIGEVVDIGTATGNGGSLVCYSGIKASAGATGQSAMTIVTAGFKAMVTLALAPSIGPGDIAPGRTGKMPGGQRQQVLSVASHW